MSYSGNKRQYGTSLEATVDEPVAPSTRPVSAVR